MKNFLSKQIKLQRLRTTDDNIRVRHSVILEKKYIGEEVRGGEKLPVYLYTIKRYSMITYEDLVVGLIRDRYSVHDECAIIRKRLAGIDTKDQFTQYNEYVEDCKTRAKGFIEERDNIK